MCPPGAGTTQTQERLTNTQGQLTESKAAEKAELEYKLAESKARLAQAEGDKLTILVCTPHPHLPHAASIPCLPTCSLNVLTVCATCCTTAQEDLYAFQSLAAHMKKVLAQRNQLKHLQLDNMLRRRFDRLPLPEA